MGTRLIAGRLFIRSDPEDVAIIDHKLAMETWPGQDPIGKRIQTGQLGRNGEWSQIVGVVEHMRHSNLQSDSRPHDLLSLLCNTRDGTQLFCYPLRRQSR